MGIPYVKPPIKNLRFKSPVFPHKWQGELLANKNVTCPQGSYFNDKFIGDEDCLYLNIYIPSKNPSKIREKLPVLFSIHGGSFIMGNGHATNGPLYLMEKNFILVSFNYRLGALGFLSTQDEIVPGNNGLKDQLAALKWVRKYIHYFGGNKDEITIIGNSAGSASVHYHLLSPLSNGLFKNAISLSGTAVNPWALQSAPLERTKQLAQALNCYSDNSHKLVECLKTKSALDIVKATHKNLFGWNIVPIAPFSPAIEPKNIKDAFLTEHPYEIMKKGQINDVPWLTTLTEAEGFCPAFAWYKNQVLIDEINHNWNKFCPYLYDFNYTQITNQNDENCLKIKQFYLGQDETVTINNYSLFVKSLSDRLFNSGIKKAAQLHASAGTQPIYTYWFNYPLETVYMLFPTDFATHGDDVPLIFSQDYENEIEISKNDKKMIEIMTHIITTFAKTSVPSLNNIEWQPVPATGPMKYLYIKSPNKIQMQIEKNDYFANTEFWKQIYLNENENLM